MIPKRCSNAEVSCSKLMVAIVAVKNPHFWWHNLLVLDKSYGAPRITKDGVTVAKEIELEDKFENMGAQSVRRKPAMCLLPRSAQQDRRPDVDFG
jgi:hypothetical protein